MRRFENILFATQGLPGHSDALAQAIMLAANNRVPVKGLIASPTFPDDLSEYQHAYESSLQDSLNQSVIKTKNDVGLSDDEVLFPIEVQSSEQPAVCIIRHVLNNHNDLVIKEAEPITDGGDGFKAIDMTLLRKCPSPVWLHRPTSKPKQKRRVAVAIDPVASTQEQHALALRLLELSRSIADSCDSRLHVISCWQHYMENYIDRNTWIKIEHEDVAKEVEEERVRHEEALQALIDESGIKGSIVIHHLHGKADDQIPTCVRERDVDVLVMGTVARTGISGFVIGNTAENVLQSIHCSLVALKPQGFKTPIAS
ncbi:universal stress protein [Vibrio maritimus]|uniref:universal stress protein n=1 Tax=Vibrio maritimus TaxID=990268 RepID=UPI0037365CC1